MNQDFPGFDKSAPGSRPGTRSQKPISAWDMDLSPFHKLIEHQANNIQQFTDLFSHKMEEIVTLLREESRQNLKKADNLQEKISQNQKNQTKANNAAQESFTEISEQLSKLNQYLQEMLDKYCHTLENIQNNTYNLIRPVTAQENLMREGYTSSQITQPLEKLVVLEQDALQQVENLISVSKEWDTFRQLTSDRYQQSVDQIAGCDKKLENIENLLISLGASLQKKFPQKQISDNSHIVEQNKLLEQISQSCSQMSQNMETQNNSRQGVENIYRKSQEILEQQQQFLAAQYQWRKKESYVFWGFMVLALILFVCIFIFKPGLP